MQVRHISHLTTDHITRLIISHRGGGDRRGIRVVRKGMLTAITLTAVLMAVNMEWVDHMVMVLKGVAHTIGVGDHPLPIGATNAIWNF